MKFFNVKKRKQVEIPEAKIKKAVYKRKTSKGVQERYAVRAQDDDGTNLTKFIDKATFDKLSCPLGK
jgi:hypothetical protein